MLSKEKKKDSVGVNSYDNTAIQITVKEASNLKLLWASGGIYYNVKELFKSFWILNEY